MRKTYAIKANRTPQDVLANNDITLEDGLTLDEIRTSVDNGGDPPKLSS